MAATAEWKWDALRASCEREVARLVRDPADREDAVQEALVRAWRQRSSCRTPRSPEAWVRQIARREALRLVAARGDERARGAWCEVDVGGASSADAVLE